MASGRRRDRDGGEEWYSSLAESPECWNLKYQQDATFPDDFLLSHLAKILDSIIPGFLQDWVVLAYIEGKGRMVEMFDPGGGAGHGDPQLRGQIGGGATVRVGSLHHTDPINQSPC